MSEVASVQSCCAGSKYPVTRASSPARPEAANDEGTHVARDRVDLSAAARNAPAVSEIPGELDSRLAEIRARIAAGIYITPDKIDVVVERLYHELSR